MTRAHRHHDVEINFLERGSVSYLINGTLATVPAHTFAVFWATVPHQLVRSEKGTGGFSWLRLPLAWLLHWKMPAGLMKPLLAGRLVLDAEPLTADLDRVRRWNGMLARESPAWSKIVLLEIQARLLALALRRPSAAKPDKIVHAGGVLKAEEIARFLAENFREALSVEKVARRVRLHPGHAMTLFRKHSGQTLLECITQHRIAHAQRLLVTTDDKVLNIALESGFGSLSRFYEAFTAACQTTPLQYRRGFAGHS